MSSRSYSPAAAAVLAAGAALIAAAFISACTQPQVTAALQSPAGQLFCAVSKSGGSAIVVAAADAAATAAAGVAAPIGISVIGALSSDVAADCQQAAVATKADTGIPVSPPANPAAAPVVTIPSAIVTKTATTDVLAPTP